MRKALLLAMLASPAAAQEPCAPYPVVTENLRTGYNETTRMRALTGDGVVIEMFAAPSGSWTIVTVTPNGVACFVSAGSYYDFFAAEPQGEDS